MDELSAGFEEHRPHLTAVAYRMLGNLDEAEDAVQDAWLRYAAVDRTQIDEPRAWLTTTTARLCLDVLRSARVRREAYVGPWLPEPLVTRLPGPGGAAGFAPDPADRAEQSDEVSYALLAVMERLSPEQRVAFVLHDVFAVPFDDVAQVLGVTTVAARQLASRGRRAVTADDAPAHHADRAEQRRVVAAFIAAVESGDFDALVALLAPDAVAIGDGGGIAPAGRSSAPSRSLGSWPACSAARPSRYRTSWSSPCWSTATSDCSARPTTNPARRCGSRWPSPSRTAGSPAFSTRSTRPSSAGYRRRSGHGRYR
jgi:RNA polymerase sigma-70 factor, ECF subfamily